jgi:hypothetical protein
MTADDRYTDDYPQPDEVGSTAAWELPLMEGGTLKTTAEFLGMATSQQDVHSHPGDYVPDNRPCPACRWFEQRIFRETGAERRYLIYTISASDLPGEVDRIRFRWAKDAYEAVFVVSVPNQWSAGKRFLPGQVRQTLEMAAERDPGIGEALAGYETQTRSRSDQGWRTA